MPSWKPCLSPVPKFLFQPQVGHFVLLCPALQGSELTSCRLINATSPLSPAEEGGEGARDSRERRSHPRGLSRGDLEQLAQGGDDVVQDLEFSDED